MWLLGWAAAAQEPLPSAPQPQARESKRIFHLVPAFDVAAGSAPYQPLTAGRKFSIMANQVVDRFTLVKAVVQGALGQASNNPKYGQGWDAYGARVGAATGDVVFYSVLGDAFFPVVLKQDPRYFREGSGSTGHRVGYALTRVFVTRGDSGNEQPNASAWLGALSGAAMSNAYYPDPDRTAGKTFARAGESLAIDAGVNILKEFWPDVQRRIFRRRRGAAMRRGGTSGEERAPQPSDHQ